MGSKASKLQRVIVKLTKAANKARKKRPAHHSSITARELGRMKYGLTNLNSNIPMFRVID